MTVGEIAEPERTGSQSDTSTEPEAPSAESLIWIDESPAAVWNSVADIANVGRYIPWTCSNPDSAA